MENICMMTIKIKTGDLCLRKLIKSSSQSFLIIISKTMQMQKPAKKHLTYIYGC